MCVGRSDSNHEDDVSHAQIHTDHGDGASINSPWDVSEKFWGEHAAARLDQVVRFVAGGER